MTHFEAYRWEDHVPRAGSWKFNLSAGLLALGLIGTALLENPGETWSAQYTLAKPTGHVRLSAFDSSRRDPLATFPGAAGEANCPIAPSEHAGS